jgi:hypothetical protein
MGQGKRENNDGNEDFGGSGFQPRLAAAGGSFDRPWKGLPQAGMGFVAGADSKRGQFAARAWLHRPCKVPAELVKGRSPESRRAEQESWRKN